jgi:large subunit ribosomal protein L29
MKVDELTALGDEQLVHKELELERSRLGHTFRHRLGQLENTSVIKTIRRDIARAQTLLGARERAGGLGKGSLRAQHRGTFVPSAAAAAAGGAGEDFLKGILDKRDAAE